MSEPITKADILQRESLIELQRDISTLENSIKQVIQIRNYREDQVMCIQSITEGKYEEAQKYLDRLKTAFNEGMQLV